MITLNPDAVQHADHLIENGDYAMNTVWARNLPSEHAARAYLEQYGVEALRRWFLAEDTDQPPDSLARYLYPLGDFKRLHISGVTAARRDAIRAEQDEIVQASENILDLIAKLNAC